MMKLKCVLGALWATSLAYGEIKQIHSYQQLMTDIRTISAKHTADRVWLVFDFDDTLLTTRSHLGGVHWFNWQESLLKQDPPAPEAVTQNFGDLLAAQGLLNETTAMKVVEPGLAERIAQLQRQHPTLILTARGPLYMYDTVAELYRNGLSFSGAKLSLSPTFEALFKPYADEEAEQYIKKWHLSPEQVQAWKLDRSARFAGYHDGVFFSSGQHKGLMLKLLIERAQTPPEAVVFVDDSLKNVHQMEAVMGHFSLPVYTYHYTRLAHDLSPREKSRMTRDWQKFSDAKKKHDARALKKAMRHLRK